MVLPPCECDGHDRSLPRKSHSKPDYVLHGSVETRVWVRWIFSDHPIAYLQYNRMYR